MPLSHNKWKEYDSNPDNNTKPPPLGAPENTTRKKDLNDIERQIMATIHEIGEWLEHVVGGPTQDPDFTLGTMAAQNSNAVSISGGTIVGSTTINDQVTVYAEAVKTGTLPTSVVPSNISVNRFAENTIQQFYDAIYPVGAVQILVASRASIPVPAGVTAVWTKIGYNGRFLQVQDSITSYPDLGGSLGAVVATAAGRTEDTTLTVNQIPPHSHTYSRTGGSGSVISGGSPYSNVVAADTGDTGGGQPHSHPLGANATISMDLGNKVPALRVQMWRRTS